ncbi:two-component system response regulator [Massilia timonae]|uniref:Diguanylate cyclase domain protein n=1 Tax=Massilia timonae TaxID=47229 RepID=A0A1S2NFF5_9BURK|nr:EAL domain-containing protein [Massilia timonae]OIJ43745.1 diguanylate cyclase domain protein [Massilia timonae]
MLQSLPGAAQDAPALLVVEDEAVVAMDIAGQLRDMGYRVCGCVDNGRDAIARARADRPDLVLMDVVLKGDMDGIAAAAAIGAELQIPILFLTAYSDDQTVDRAAGAMPYGYLTKPFQGRELRAVIEVALRKAEVERALRDKERWLSSVLHGVGDAVIALDADGRVGLANPAAESLLGAEILRGRSAAEVVRLEDDAGGTVGLAHHDCTARSGAAMLVTGAGQRIPVDYSAGPICDERSHPMGTAIVLHDERERVAAELRLAHSEQRFRSAFDNAPLGLALVDRDNRYARVNRAMCRLLGAPAEALVGAVQDAFGDSGDNAIEREYQQDLLAGRSDAVQYERRYRPRDGRTVWALVSATLLPADHEPQHFLIQVNDVTERKRAEEELAHLAHHDALTRVANRAMLSEQVERELAVARRRGSRLAVVFIDLDYFKHINDTYGHETGDVVLKELASRLAHSVRAIDIVGRLGGDEFVVVLSEVSDARDVVALTDKLRLECGRPLHFNGHEVRLAVSMGVSLFPDDARDFRTLLRFADSALYQAKGEGRNNVQFYRPELTARMEMRVRLGAGLRTALERGELEMFYQPIVALADGRPAAAEALLRWHHPELGLLMPDLFLPMLEESSMAEEIGAWTIREACRQAARWNADGGAGLRIGVNVTAAQFKSGRLAPVVEAALRATGLAPGRLCIEITEQSQLADTGQTRATLAALKDLGVLVAIDDFGTGYSSLGYISRLKPDELKVDKSLVTDVDTDAERAGVVVAALAMARSLRLLVVAEGVETEAEQAFLQAHGCDMAQGFLHARPIPAPEFEAWLAAAGRPRGAGGAPAH